MFADSRSIVHAGDGLQHVAAPPDVCKTPSPGGPVPVPYVNVAASSNLAKGTKKVKLEGKSAATSAANLSTSVGDEPGTAGGGLVSSKTKGKTTWATSSMTVKFEGKGAVRFLDVTQQNGNTFNTAFMNLGQPYTAMAYGDDFVGDCEVCGYEPAEHRIHESENTLEIAAEIRAGLRSIDPQSVSKKQRDVLSSSFMIGVMICRCNRIFISRSGTDPNGTGGIFNAFWALAQPYSRNGQFERGDVTPDSLAAVNPFPPDQQLTDPATAIQTAWAGALYYSARDEQRRPIRPDNGYLRPGTCAAQRLLQADHAPRELTEMFYTPARFDAGDRPAEPMVIPYLRTDLPPETIGWFLSEPPLSREVVLQNRLADVVDFPFEPGETVGSCESCQDMLYMTNCPTRECPRGE